METLRYGKWHTLYTRMLRWCRAGVLDQVFKQLQRRRLMQVRIEAVCLDSRIVKVHPDDNGTPRKTGP
ncbi:transposase [Noviherbaspirillum aerium]|uniref:transposase n=1 Tax=Noviherbaspirillum aerium TaxID=2588497 RepID=UPI00124D34BB|nr:transposase [Noviherbaspirillum aerium]